MVKWIIDYFESKGLKIISAAYDGFEKCETIGNHEPDVIAQKPDEDFGNTIMLKTGVTRTYLPFCIAVPKKCIDDLKKYILDFGLSMNENIETLAL